MDPAVLEELRQGEARDLSAKPVKGGEHHCVRRVVDDEVDAGEMLEGTDVPALPADDPPLHVVRRKLDHSHRRLRGVARGDPLQRIRDEIPCAALRVGASFVLEHPDAPCELVPGLFLTALDNQRSRFRLGQAGHALELGHMGVLRVLELLLKAPDVLLAVGEPLITAGELAELLLDLELLRQYAFLDLQHLGAPVGELGVDLASQPDRLLAGFDLRLPAHRVALALGVFEQLLADPPRLRDSGCAEDRHGEQGERSAAGDPDGNSDPDQHCRLLRRGLTRLVGGTSHPAPGLSGSYPRSLIRRGRRPPKVTALPRA